MLESNGRLYVYSVDSDGKAYAGGMRANDWITKITFKGNEYSISSESDYNSAMQAIKQNCSMGDTITFLMTRRTGFNSVTQYDTTLTISQYIFRDTGV